MIGPIGPIELIFFGIFLLPWIIALVDILRSEFTGANKIVWLLVVIFLPVIGFLLYFLIGRNQKIKLPE